MNNTIACIKWVLDPDDIVVTPEGNVDYTRARMVLSEYDSHAITAAADIAKQNEGTAYGLTFSPEVPRQLEKDVLSRGLDELIYVKDEAAKAVDAPATASVLAAAVKTMECIGLVVCAEGASDTFARQIPSRIAALLDWPVITSVCSYELEGDNIVAMRRLEDSMQKVIAPLPAVISVLPEANEAKIPSMKAILSAGKKPVNETNLAALGVDVTSKTKDLTEKGYVSHRKSVMLEGTPEELAAQLKSALVSEGVL